MLPARMHGRKGGADPSGAIAAGFDPRIVPIMFVPAKIGTKEKAAIIDPRQVQRSEAVGARTRDLRIKSPLLYQLSYSLLCRESEHF